MCLKVQSAGFFIFFIWSNLMSFTWEHLVWQVSILSSPVLSAAAPFTLLDDISKTSQRIIVTVQSRTSAAAAPFKSQLFSSPFLGTRDAGGVLFSAMVSCMEHNKVTVSCWTVDIRQRRRSFVIRRKKKKRAFPYLGRFKCFKIQVIQHIL